MAFCLHFSQYEGDGEWEIIIPCIWFFIQSHLESFPLSTMTIIHVVNAVFSASLYTRI